MIHLIASVTPHGVIGRDGRQPWAIAEDRQLFASLTRGHPVIMGRKTYEDIGRALPQRHTIVLSRTLRTLPGAAVYRSLPAALAAARERNPDVYVIGGGDVYRQTMQYADVLHLSLVKQNYAGNVVFPEVAEAAWQETDRQSFNDFTYVQYRRRTQCA